MAYITHPIPTLTYYTVQPWVLAAVNASDAIFFAGGDQTYYVEYFIDQLGSALATRAFHVTVGGTSAGADYLSDIVYAPPHDAAGATSAVVMANPYDYSMAFANSSFHFTNEFGVDGARRVIADTHYEQRDRMGRGLTFAARVIADGDVSVDKGGCAYIVAINERTAVLIEPGGSASVVGSTSAFVCSLCTEPTRCQSGQPLTAGPYACTRLDVGDAYDFSIWSGGGTNYELSVQDGSLVGEPYGPAMRRGSRRGVDGPLVSEVAGLPRRHERGTGNGASVDAFV